MLTAALYDRLAGDGILVGMLGQYGGEPAIFTTDPAPGNAPLPHIVTAGEVTAVPFDTKTTLGRTVRRDLRCYAAATGSAVLIEQIAERVRVRLHRQPLEIAGHAWLISDISGPIVADERDVYGRILSLSLTAQETEV